MAQSLSQSWSVPGLAAIRAICQQRRASCTVDMTTKQSVNRRFFPDTAYTLDAVSLLIRRSGTKPTYLVIKTTWAIQVDSIYATTWMNAVRSHLSHDHHSHYGKDRERGTHMLCVYPG